MRTAIYCRVSTDGQENGSSLETQAEACLKEAVELGYEVPDGLLIKETMSGLKLDRPGLDCIRENIRQKNIDAVIVYTTDRLSRDPIHFIILQEEMEKYGVKLILVTETIDSSDLGKLISHIRGYAAKLEVEKIKERCSRGKRKLLSDGKFCQGNPGIYGYDWLKADHRNKQLSRRIINEPEANIVKRIFEMLAQGISRYQIAMKLNDLGVSTKFGSKWHPWTIENIGKNTAYKGLTYFGKTRQDGKERKLVPEGEWILLPNVTPAIIDEELFDRVQKIIKLGKELHNSTKTQNDYLLRGHIKCGYCGNFLVGTCLNKRFRYYHCSRSYKTSVRAATCKAGYIRAKEIEDTVWSKVREVIEHPNVILADLKRRIDSRKNGDKYNAAKVEKEISDTNKRLKAYRNQEKRLVKLYSLEKIDDKTISEELTRLSNSKLEDEHRLAQLTASREVKPDLDSIEAQLRDFNQKVKSNLNNCDLKTKRLALDVLDVQVIAIPDKMTIKVIVPLEFTPIQRTYEYQLQRSKQSGPRRRSKKTTVIVEDTGVYITA
jgi:site-specific DNA recombinase